MPHQSHVIDRPDPAPEAVPSVERPSSHGVETSRRDVVDIFMIPLGGSGSVFYWAASARKEARRSHEAAAGPRGWLERKFRAMQSALHGSQGGMGLRLRHFWSWLQLRIPPDEALLRRLRKAKSIVVHHPSTVTSEDVRVEWETCLASRRVRHLLGLALNLAIAPLTVLLAVLPGPNVVGFWFVYRIVCHALALLGIRRASGPLVTTDFRPSEDLDVVPGETLRSRAARIAAGHRLAGLGAFLKRIAGNEMDRASGAGP